MTSEGRTSDQRRAAVYRRPTAEDPWRLWRGAEPLTATASALPTVPSARIRYHYGEIRREGDDAYETYSKPIGLDRHQVQIRLLDEGQKPLDSVQVFRRGAGGWPQYGPGEAVWTGLICDASHRPDGTGYPFAGRVVYQCYGFTHLLDRLSVDHAYFAAQNDLDVKKIGRVPPMNGSRTHGAGPGLGTGNRSSSHVEGTYVYAEDGETWNNLQMIRYLLGQVVDRAYPDAAIGWELAGQTELLENLSDTYDGDGNTVLQWIRHLCPRRRGLILTEEWDVDRQSPRLRVRSTLGDSIDVGEGYEQLPASDAIRTFNYDDRAVDGPEIEERHSARYDKIHVRGGRVRSTFTLSPGNDDMTSGWTDAEETEYENADEDERQSDALSHVWTRYEVVDAWDWMLPGASAAPPVYDTGEVSLDDTSSAPQFQPDKEFLRSAVLPDSAGGTRPPVAYAPVDVDGSTRWVQLDAGYSPANLPSCGLETVGGDLAVQVRAHPPHLLAKNHSSASYTDPPVVDYEDVRITVTVELDQRLEVERDVPDTFLDDLDDEDGVAPRELTIRRPEARLDYVANATVYGASGGTLDETDDGQLVRNDYPYLRRLAALAAAWYQRPRRVVHWTRQRLVPDVRPGVFAEEVSYEAVNTPISQVEWSFEDGTTSYRTAWQELELDRVVRVPGLSDLRAVSRKIRDHEEQLDELRERTGNLPSRFFFRQKIGIGVYEPADTKLIQATGTPASMENQQVWNDSSGEWENTSDGLALGKFQSPIELTTAEDGVIWPKGSPGLRAVYNTNHVDGQTGYWKAAVTLKAITEDFDIGALNRGDLESLTGLERNLEFYAGGSSSFSMTARRDIGPAIVQPTSTQEIHGIAIYVDTGAYDEASLDHSDTDDRELEPWSAETLDAEDLRFSTRSRTGTIR